MISTRNDVRARTYLSAKERRGYSIGRAILAAGSPQMNCMEREVSQAFCRDTTTTGFVIPPEILYGEGPAELRAINASSASAGGYLLTHEVGPLMDYLFPQSVIFRLGAGFIPNASSDVSVPRVSSSDEAEWLQETQAASGNHNSAFGQIITKPHRAYAERTVSKQLLIQNAFGDALVSKLLMGAYAAAIDRAALIGTGGVQPLGLMNDANVTTIAIGANGGAPTLAVLNDVEGTPIGNKVSLNAPGWVVSSNTREKLKNTAKATSTSTFLLETKDNVDQVNGFTGYATASLPDDGAKGSGTNLGSALFGADWSTLQVALFGGLEITSDPFTEARNGRVIVSLNAFLDVIKQRTEAFAKVTDIVTT